MRDITIPDNEWLVVELRLCRAAIGLTQKELSDLTGLALPSIKRLEKKGAQPRYSTINKVRQTFRLLGVNCIFDDNGQINIELTDELVNVINSGELKEYIKRHIPAD